MIDGATKPKLTVVHVGYGKSKWPTPLAENPWGPTIAAKDAYCGLVGEIVRTLAPETEADEAALVVFTLVIFGNVVGRGPHFNVGGTRHGVNLATVAVGKTSSGRKGTAQGEVERPIKLAAPDWYDNCRAPSLSTGEGLIYRLRDDEYGEDKKTGEWKVVKRGRTDKRLLVTQSEFASMLSVMSRDGNTLSPAFRCAIDGQPLEVMTRTDPYKATDTHVSLIGSITDEELKKKLSETEISNGFANRVLWVCVKDSKDLPNGGNLSADKLDLLSRKLAQAIQYAEVGDDWDGEMHRDAGADALWVEWYEYLKNGDYDSGPVGQATGRGLPLVMRMACIYALMDRSRIVQRPHLEAALRVWEYCVASAEYIFGGHTGSSMGNKILSHLHDMGGMGATKTHLHNDVFYRNINGAVLQREITDLEGLGLVVHDKHKEFDDYRPTTYYYLATVRPELVPYDDEDDDDL